MARFSKKIFTKAFTRGNIELEQVKPFNKRKFFAKIWQIQAINQHQWVFLGLDLSVKMVLPVERFQPTGAVLYSHLGLVG